VKENNGKNKTTNDTKAVLDTQKTNAQTVSKQQLLWKDDLPVFIAEQDPLPHGISPWPAQVSCPDCVPS